MHNQNNIRFTFGFDTAKGVFEKLKRDVAILEADYRNKDAIFNFVITAYHLYDDWLKKDPLISQLQRDKYNSTKNELKDLIGALYAVANSSKHSVLKEYKVNNVDFNVVGTSYGEVTDWLSFYLAKFPTINTKEAQYDLWQLDKVYVEYLEWVFNDQIISSTLPHSLEVKLNLFKK